MQEEEKVRLARRQSILKTSCGFLGILVLNALAHAVGDEVLRITSVSYFIEHSILDRIRSSRFGLWTLELELPVGLFRTTGIYLVEFGIVLLGSSLLTVGSLLLFGRFFQNREGKTCLSCGYPTQGLPGPRCPECGKVLP